MWVQTPRIADRYVFRHKDSETDLGSGRETMISSNIGRKKENYFSSPNWDKDKLFSLILSSSTSKYITLSELDFSATF